MYLVYQTTPLFGGMRPIFVTEERAIAKRYCDRINETEEGYGFCAIEERDHDQGIGITDR